jgi:uncharacterized 2Fe-2S/4Fe-4S cluster protein (DUF4445 family)
MPISKTNPQSFAVNLQPVGRRAEIQPGMTLLHAAQVTGVELISLCGGIGACDSCKVRLVKGKLSRVTLEEEALFSADELAAGYRLACQATPLSDVTIDIPSESLTTPQRLQVEGQEVEVALQPMVSAIDLHLEPPALHDLRADTARLKDALADQRGEISPFFNHALLKTLSDDARRLNWKMRLVLRGDEIIAILPPEEPGRPAPLLGLAVDVGSTKLAAYLTDLSTGKTLAKAGVMNPQIAFGEDVVSRVAYANANPGGSRWLHERLIEAVNALALEMCAEASQSGILAERGQIVDAVVVGNTAMHHFFSGLPVAQLGTAPYVPAVNEALDFPAGQVGLQLAPGAYVHLPPNIAGYVGADHVSMVLATDVIHKTGRTVIALDIGTNTEITLAHKGRLLSCSCASGPAFEGAHIQDGMRAAPGAIERVQITGQGVRIHTIGDQPPVGICGSGILDVVAEMISAGILDRRGVMQSGHPLVRSVNGRNEFLLAPAELTGHGRDVVVNRKDVNEIQLAKGAIRTGIEILLAAAGLASPQAIDEFIVAGAFGTYISVESAIRVGMFPDLPLERFQQVGNAAGSGARQMLVSSAQRRLADEIAGQIEYVELAGNPEFIHTFSQMLYFNPVEAS